MAQKSATWEQCHSRVQNACNNDSILYSALSLTPSNLLGTLLFNIHLCIVFINQFN